MPTFSPLQSSLKDYPLYNGLAVCALLLMGGLALSYYLTIKRQKNFTQIPGPPSTNWLGGNISQMPKEKPWLKMKEWGDTYGKV